MVLGYSMAADTASEFYGFWFCMLALADGEVLLIGEVSSMHESLREELIEDTIECRLIHLTSFDEGGL